MNSVNVGVLGLKREIAKDNVRHSVRRLAMPGDRPAER